MQTHKNRMAQKSYISQLSASMSAIQNSQLSSHSLSNSGRISSRIDNLGRSNNHKGIVSQSLSRSSSRIADKSSSIIQSVSVDSPSASNIKLIKKQQLDNQKNNNKNNPYVGINVPFTRYDLNSIFNKDQQNIEYYQDSPYIKQLRQQTLINDANMNKNLFFKYLSFSGKKGIQFISEFLKNQLITIFKQYSTINKTTEDNISIKQAVSCNHKQPINKKIIKFQADIQPEQLISDNNHNQNSNLLKPQFSNQIYAENSPYYDNTQNWRHKIGKNTDNNFKLDHYNTGNIYNHKKGKYDRSGIQERVFIFDCNLEQKPKLRTKFSLSNPKYFDSQMQDKSIQFDSQNEDSEELQYSGQSSINNLGLQEQKKQSNSHKMLLLNKLQQNQQQQQQDSFAFQRQILQQNKHKTQNTIMQNNMLVRYAEQIADQMAKIDLNQLNPFNFSGNLQDNSQPRKRIKLLTDQSQNIEKQFDIKLLNQQQKIKSKFDIKKIAKNDIISHSKSKQYSVNNKQQLGNHSDIFCPQHYCQSIHRLQQQIKLKKHSSQAGNFPRSIDSVSKPKQFKPARKQQKKPYNTNQIIAFVKESVRKQRQQKAKIMKQQMETQKQEIRKKLFEAEQKRNENLQAFQQNNLATEQKQHQKPIQNISLSAFSPTSFMASSTIFTQDKNKFNNSSSGAFKMGDINKMPMTFGFGSLLQGSKLFDSNPLLKSNSFFQKQLKAPEMENSEQPIVNKQKQDNKQQQKRPFGLSFNTNPISSFNTKFSAEQNSKNSGFNNENITKQHRTNIDADDNSHKQPANSQSVSIGNKNSQQQKIGKQSEISAKLDQDSNKQQDKTMNVVRQEEDKVQKSKESEEAPSKDKQTNIQNAKNSKQNDKNETQNEGQQQKQQKRTTNIVNPFLATGPTKGLVLSNIIGKDFGPASIFGNNNKQTKKPIQSPERPNLLVNEVFSTPTKNMQDRMQEPYQAPVGVPPVSLPLLGNLSPSKRQQSQQQQDFNDSSMFDESEQPSQPYNPNNSLYGISSSDINQANNRQIPNNTFQNQNPKLSDYSRFNPQGKPLSVVYNNYKKQSSQQKRESFLLPQNNTLMMSSAPNVPNIPRQSFYNSTNGLNPAALFSQPQSIPQPKSLFGSNDSNQQASSFNSGYARKSSRKKKQKQQRIY